MRILWFTNIPMPAMDVRLGRVARGTGWWMSSLLERLQAAADVKLAVACVVSGAQELQFNEGGVDYFVIPQSRWSGRFDWLGARAEPGLLSRCAQIARQWKADLIHIHGTERLYGQMKVRGLAPCPTIISIQGLLGPCSQKVNGGLSLRETIRMHTPRELLYGATPWQVYRRWRRAARAEKASLAAADAVLGRTDWDRAQTWAVNPAVPYYRVGEILRPEFYEADWRLENCRCHRIMVTNARSPMRGFDTIIDAMKLLRPAYPDIRVALAAGIGIDSAYGRLLIRQIANAGLTDRVEMLGWLDSAALVRELCGSHVFAIASHIENSPNSLCEAMTVGMPCVASYVGGIPSLIEHGRTGLMFPPGDAAFLAARLRAVFEDDALAARMGVAARQVAQERHAPARVVGELLSAYHSVAGAKLAEGSDIRPTGMSGHIAPE